MADIIPTRQWLREQVDAQVHVVGLASAEGMAVIRLLLRLGFSNIVAHDARPGAALRAAFRSVHGAWSGREQQRLWDEVAPVRAVGRFDADYLTGLETADIVVLGQGWQLDAGNRRAILDRLPENAVVLSMTALYAGLLSEHAAPLIGITGTNGKSTTVALVDHLLTVAGVHHSTAGNDRGVRQFLPELADPSHDPGVAVLEVSNRQLAQVTPPVDIAAITSLTPDHLGEHGGWDGYRSIKASLFAAQPASGWAVVNSDDAEAVAAASAGNGRLVRCSARSYQRSGPAVSFRGDELVAVDLPGLDAETVLASAADLTMPGRHNRSNACVAVACALLAGAPPGSIRDGLASFTGKAQRLESLGVAAGIHVINDVKSTTPQATLAAVDAVAGDGDAGQLLVICGGEDKGLDYRPLARRLAAAQARCLIVPGTASELLVAALAEAGGEAERIDDARAALAGLLDEGPAAGVDTVLVSPAAAGFQSGQLAGQPTLRKLVARYTPAQEVARQ